MLRFIQLSDLRYGATPRIGGAALEVPDALRHELRGDAGQALARVAELAAAHGVDAVLVAGDLLEEGSCTVDDLRALHQLIARVPVPVVVAPGARDAVWPGSALSAERALLELEPRAPNLHVLEMGRPFVLGPYAVQAESTAGEIAIQHEGRTWTCLAAGGEAQPRILREGDAGDPRGGHPGAPIAHALPGAVGGAWLVELGESVRLTLLDIAPRRGWTVDLDVSAVTRPAELEAQARAALASLPTSASDLVWLKLGGVWRLAAPPQIHPGALTQACAHAWVVPGDLVLTPPHGPAAMDLHLRLLTARVRGQRADEALLAVELAFRAWQEGRR